MCFNQQVIYVIYYITLFQMLLYGSKEDVFNLATFSNAFRHAFHSVTYPVFPSIVYACQVGYFYFGLSGGGS